MIKLKYTTVFFAQGEDADEWLRILDEFGATALVTELDAAGVDMLADTDYNDEKPWGTLDQTFDVVVGSKGIFTVSVNWSMGYLGVTRVESA
jgi:hypothetical protein